MRYPRPLKARVLTKVNKMSAEQSPKKRRDTENMVVVAPFAMAVIGTFVTLVANSATALKLSLLFALWSAIAGIIFMHRARQERDRAARVAAERGALLSAAHAQMRSPADAAAIRELQQEIRALRAQVGQAPEEHGRRHRGEYDTNSLSVADLMSRRDR